MTANYHAMGDAWRDAEARCDRYREALEEIAKWADEMSRTATSQQEYKRLLMLAGMVSRTLGRSVGLRNAESRPEDGSRATAMSDG